MGKKLEEIKTEYSWHHITELAGDKLSVDYAMIIKNNVTLTCCCGGRKRRKRFRNWRWRCSCRHCKINNSNNNHLDALEYRSRKRNTVYRNISLIKDKRQNIRKCSVVVLEESPCPWGSSRTTFPVLVFVLVLGTQVLVLVLEAWLLVLVLILESQVLDNNTAEMSEMEKLQKSSRNMDN